MAWVGSVCDQETARKSAGTSLLGQNVYSVLAASLSSVAVAQAAVAANALTMSVCDRPNAVQVSKGYKVAYNLGGTFSSSYSVLYASLPDSTGHPRVLFG